MSQKDDPQRWSSLCRWQRQYKTCQLKGCHTRTEKTCLQGVLYMWNSVSPMTNNVIHLSQNRHHYPLKKKKKKWRTKKLGGILTLHAVFTSQTSIQHTNSFFHWPPLTIHPNSTQQCLARVSTPSTFISLIINSKSMETHFFSEDLRNTYFLF